MKAGLGADVTKGHNSLLRLIPKDGTETQVTSRKSGMILIMSVDWTGTENLTK